MILNTDDKKLLLDLARNTIEHAILKKSKFQPSEIYHNEKFKIKSASFVTLRIDDDLRGCIGSVHPERDLISDISENAISSAMKDPRFPPLMPDELKNISIEISVLHSFEIIENKGRDKLLEILKPGVDGLIIEENFRRATFLPSVWEALPSPNIFLGKLLVKAGLPDSYWSKDMKITLYKTESFL